MRVEINRGVGSKSEVILQGNNDLIDLNKLYDELIVKGEGYRLEVYRN